MAGDTDSVTTEHPQEMAPGLSNGHVTGVTSRDPKTGQGRDPDLLTYLLTYKIGPGCLCSIHSLIVAVSVKNCLTQTERQTDRRTNGRQGATGPAERLELTRVQCCSDQV